MNECEYVCLCSFECNNNIICLPLPQYLHIYIYKYKQYYSNCGVFLHAIDSTATRDDGCDDRQFNSIQNSQQNDKIGEAKDVSAWHNIKHACSLKRLLFFILYEL